MLLQRSRFLIFERDIRAARNKMMQNHHGLRADCMPEFIVFDEAIRIFGHLPNNLICEHQNVNGTCANTVFCVLFEVGVIL